MKVIIFYGTDCSDNDPFISEEALNDFAKELNAKIITIVNGGHFNASAGYNEFPQLLKIISEKNENPQEDLWKRDMH